MVITVNRDILANLGLGGEDAAQLKIAMAKRPFSSNGSTPFQPITGAVKAADSAQHVTAQNLQQLDGEYVLLVQPR
jgi:hypothetical protein